MNEWWEKYVGKVANAGTQFPDENWLDLVSINNYKLHTYRFHNPNPKAIICCFHGMYSESNESSHIAARFYDDGYAVIAMDQEGHGKSGGPPGNILSLENYRKDSETFIIKAQASYPENTPIFILGLSMGGAICIMLSLSRPDLIAGMILCAPAVGVSPDFEPFLQKIVRCLNCCCGCLKLKKFDIKLSTRNQDYANYFQENPYNYNGRMNVRTAIAMLDGLEALQTKVSNVITPLLVFQGNADKIVSPDDTKRFVENCKSTDKEIVIYDDMYHDIYQEPEILEIIDKHIKWVNERVGNNRGDNEIL